MYERLREDVVIELIATLTKVEICPLRQISIRYSILVTLNHSIFNFIVAEIVRWNDTIRNVGVRLSPVETA